MIVATSTGKVEGAPAGDGHHDIVQFRGMPYAQAERFRPPRPATPWVGVRDATSFSAVAPQNVSATDQLFGLAPDAADEDCLTLNVFTPAADDGGRPVLVWVHGGGFTSGCGHLPHYDACNLIDAADGDLVVVSFNYRLGALGFLHVGELAGSSEWPGSGVNGLADQVAALRWVRDNIVAFGGHPDRVTLFGQSAGGMSVAALLAVPEAQGLFHAAIAQSGAAERLLRSDQAGGIAEKFAAALGSEDDNGPATVDELLVAPVGQLLAAQAKVEASQMAGPARVTASGRPTSGFLQLPFQPMVDGTLLPQPPLDAVRSGSAAGVPLVTGTTRDEWRLFTLSALGDDIGDDVLRQRAARLTGDDAADEAIRTYRAARPTENAIDLWCSIASDYVFRMPALRLADAQSAHSPHVAMYRFDYPSVAFGGLPRACHAVDVPFVFNNVAQPTIDMMLGGVDDTTRHLAIRCARAWAAVAATGRPAHDDLTWPAYEPQRRSTCILDREVTVTDNPEGSVRELWETVQST